MQCIYDKEAYGIYLMRIYMDNCCYNRPYDNQSQMRIHLETQAKLYIQQLVQAKKLELVTSYVLEYENSHNKFAVRKTAIQSFINEYESFHVGVEHKQDVEKQARLIMASGVKEKDAAHVACAENCRVRLFYYHR